MKKEQISAEISSRSLEGMTAITTYCRPVEKSNTILVTVVDGKKWHCERPRYFWSALDRSFLEAPFIAEEHLLYPAAEEPMGVFDDRGLWWARQEMSSIGLVPFFLKNPSVYLRMMARHTRNVGEIVRSLEHIKSSLSDPSAAATNLRAFVTMYGTMYDCQATIFTTFDELAYQFRQFLLDRLPREQVNRYFPQFLSGEATKAALENGILENEDGVEQTASRGVLYAMHRTPHLFYAQPKFFPAIDGDDEIAQSLIKAGCTADELEKFFSFRSMIPAGFQINEESQYMESVILSPHLGIVMRAVSSVLNRSIAELEEMSVQQIIDTLEARTATPILKGIGVSRGSAEGIVRIVNGLEDSDRFREGDILVTRITDPTMVSMMARAGAIVCDIGSMTSHPSIVSREMGIPCVVNTKPGTKVLTDGTRVCVDGTTGEIFYA
ncbi:MAG: PEP-utilizing enzyme [Patescibacteria group bacterium]